MGSAKGRRFNLATDAVERFGQDKTIEGLNAAVAASVAICGYCSFCFASGATMQRPRLKQRRLRMALSDAWYREHDRQNVVAQDAVAATLRTTPVAFRWSDLNVETTAGRREPCLSRINASRGSTLSVLEHNQPSHARARA